MDVNAESTPWVSAVSYWHPPRIVLSAWLEHAPFAFWIMSALRPSTLVELGTHNGFSFFTFCEAAQRLDLDATLYAVDTWRGDDHAGFYGDEIYDDVAAVAQTQYPGLAVLLRGYFSDFVGTFADGSIDLLHIDGRHAYDDVKEDFESWVPKVAEHGVVLFHDIAVLDRDFGVNRFFTELAETYPTFRFEHGNGLGVLSIGAPAPGVEALFGASPDEAERIRAFYAERGGLVTAEWDERVIRDAAHLRALNDVQGELAGARSELDDVRASTSWRVTRPLRALGSKLRRS